MKRISVLLVAVILIIGVMGCGNSNEETNEPATFTYADNTTAVSGTITPMGGTIEVGYNGTPIDGVQVEFPEGALTEDANVSLGYNAGALTPNEGIYAGFALTIDTGDISQFEQAVIVTVPFEDIDGTPVPYYVDSDGRLHPVLLLEIDRTERTFTFAIFHASTFTWIVSLLAGSETPSAPVIVTYQTGYYPDDDGFQIVNSHSEYAKGECFGMSAFSAWYFMQKKGRHVEDDFYPSYMNVIDTDWRGHPLYGQDIIATRATLSANQVWDTFYSGTLGAALSLSDADKWASITSAMENTAGPVLIYLPENEPLVDGAHAVVAYSYDNLGHIFFYDPNHPGERMGVEYDISKRSFHWYEFFNDLALLGDYASLTAAPAESFDNILKDADADFHDSGIATVYVTSHSQGQTVNGRDIVLRGEIYSGQVLVTALRVSRQYTQFSTDVGYDGCFSLCVRLESGINYLRFVTEGKDFDGEVIEIPNSMGTVGLVIVVSESVHFPDANLEVAIREAIGKPTGDIYQSDLAGLTEFDAFERNIADLTGLEYCTSLRGLYLGSNGISDISPLASLTNLESVYLYNNQISDISPLAGLTKLTYLHLNVNQISDISPLAGLTSLTTFLGVNGNQISDVSPLASLTNLTSLWAADNQISDVSPLASLVNLRKLCLDSNQIRDVSPLVSLTGLEWLLLSDNGITNLQPLSSLSNLTYLWVAYNQISDISPLAGLTSLTYLGLFNNQISDVSPLLQNVGLGTGDAVSLWDNPLGEDSLNIYIPQLRARGVTVNY